MSGLGWAWPAKWKSPLSVIFTQAMTAQIHVLYLWIITGAPLSISKFVSEAGTLQSISHCLLCIKPESSQDLVPIFDFSPIPISLMQQLILKHANSISRTKRLFSFYNYVLVTLTLGKAGITEGRTFDTIFTV